MAARKKYFVKKGEDVGVSRRIYLIRIVDKVDKNKKFADKIGTINQSKLRTEKKEK